MPSAFHAAQSALLRRPHRFWEGHWQSARASCRSERNPRELAPRSIVYGQRPVAGGTRRPYLAPSRLSSSISSFFVAVALSE